MSNDMRDEGGPLRHFRMGRRAVLQSLATGVGVTMLGAKASAAHVHGAAAAATPAEPAAASSLLFLDQHAFDTLALLSEQIVPGSRAAKVPEFLDRLLSVESLETQKRFTQAIGAFEQESRMAYAKPWKALTETESTALLTKISTQSTDDTIRQIFDGLKGAISESYYSSEPGLKELGWNGTFAFAPPPICG